MTIHPRKQRLITLYGHDPLSMDEVAQAVIVMLNDNVRRPDKFRQYDGNNKVLGFAWELSHSMSVSNSHHAPLDGFTNWDGRDKRANGVRGYPGWTGRVWVRFKKRPGSFGSDPFIDTLTHPGTGGGGTYNGPWEKLSTTIYQKFGHKRPTGLVIPSAECYSYDYQIFDSDFPSVKETDLHKKMVMWNKLQDKGTARLEHKFCWEDQHVVKLDKEFLAEYKKRA